MSWVETTAMSWGIRLDPHVSFQDKLLSVVNAQRAVMSDRNTSMGFAGAAILLLVLASAGRGSQVSTSVMSVMLSFMWAAMAILVLGSIVEAGQATGQGWPVEGVIFALLYGIQSVLVAITGTSRLISFGTPLSGIFKRPSHQVAAGLLISSYIALAVHNATRGRFFKMAFPVDVFTLGLVLGSALPSGYSKMLLKMPFLLTFVRSSVDIMLLKDYEHLPVPCLVLIAYSIQTSWSQPSDPYRWVAPDLRPDSKAQRERRDRRNKAIPPRTDPLMQETRKGEDGGVQGMAAVQSMQMIDEDGDEAMEFFEVTDQGLKKRNPTAAGVQAKTES